MILKIRQHEKWIYFDKVDKFIKHGKVRVSLNDSTVEDKNNDTIYPDAVYMEDVRVDEKDEGILVEIISYQDNDETYFSRTIVVDTAYLLNDDGQTIERL